MLLYLQGHPWYIHNVQNVAQVLKLNIKNHNCHNFAPKMKSHRKNKIT